MESKDDSRLRGILKEWELEGAPESLDARVAAFRRSWWSFLWTGSIRVPVPVGLAALAILLAMTFALVRRQAAAPATPGAISLVDFRPVHDVNVRVIHGHEPN